jgi:hypothetical protein
MAQRSARNFDAVVHRYGQGGRFARIETTCSRSALSAQILGADPRSARAMGESQSLTCPLPKDGRSGSIGIDPKAVKKR